MKKSKLRDIVRETVLEVTKENPNFIFWNLMDTAIKLLASGYTEMEAKKWLDKHYVYTPKENRAAVAKAMEHVQKYPMVEAVNNPSWVVRCKKGTIPPWAERLQAPSAADALNVANEHHPENPTVVSMVKRANPFDLSDREADVNKLEKVSNRVDSIERAAEEEESEHEARVVDYEDAMRKATHVEKELIKKVKRTVTENKIMNKSELRKIISEAVAEVLHEESLPPGLPPESFQTLDQFLQDSQVTEGSEESQDARPAYIIEATRMWVRDDVAEAILNLPTTSFSAGANAKNFKEHDYAYFVDGIYQKRGNPSNYKAKIALRKDPTITPRKEGYSYVVVAISGSFGMGGLQQAAKYVFARYIRKVIFDAAKNFIDTKVKNLNEADMLGATTKAMSPEDMQGFLGRTKDKGLSKAEKYKMPYVHGSNIEIKDGQDRVYDLDKLKAAITTRPAKILKMNKKMELSGGEGAIFFDIGLPALKGLAVNEKTGEFIVVDTCPGAGACKVYCYAKKGGYVQWKDASMSQTKLLNFLVNDPSGFSTQFENELTSENNKAKKKGKKVVVRWHDAGDFFSPEYLDLAYEIAKKFPDVKFYAYTKMASVATGTKPSNFVINFSMGATEDEEKQIDFSKTKHSTVVPKPMFDKYMLKDEKGKLVRDDKDRMQFASDEDLDKFRADLAAKHKLDIDSIITYDQLLKIPESDELNKYNVIIRPGDGDVSASRRDVKGTYLLIH